MSVTTVYIGHDWLERTDSRIFKLSHIFGIIDHPAYRGQNEHTSKIIIVHLAAPGVRLVTQSCINALLALGFFSVIC